MLVASEREQLVLWTDWVETDHGRLEVWVDGLITWKAGFRAHETPAGVEQLDSQAHSWTNGIQDLISDRQRSEARDVVDGYLAELLREVNEVFSDSSDPMCEAWEQSATLLRHIYSGLVEYYLSEADLFLEGSHEAMPAFAQLQEVSLCGGLRRFELATSEVDGEQIIWAVASDRARNPAHGPFQADPRDHVPLADVVDYATGKETRQVIELHVFAMAQAADHLRFVINKLRAEVPITLPEMVRLRSFAGTILNFQEQLRQAT